MIKLLFVIGATKSGGAEKRAVFISNLLKKNFETRVFAFYGSDTEGVDYIFKKEYADYKKESLKSRINNLKDYISDYNPDIVISFVPHINFFATKAIKKAKNKSIKHIVSMVFHDFSRVSTFLLKYSIKRADSVYYQTEEQQQIVKCKCNSFVLPNPINVPDFKEKDCQFKFMSAGRLEHQKDYQTLINSFAFIKNQYPSASLDIYGSGSQKSELLELINSLKLNDSAKIIEYTDSINDRFKEHDVFLFTTRYEGFPNALAEAMANGLICFTTRFKTGCSELVVDNKTGYICESRDPQEYANKVIEKLNEYNQAKIVAKNGIEHISKLCSTEQFINKITAILYEIKD